MSKKKKHKKQPKDSTEKILLATAIVSLINALLEILRLFLKN